MHDLEFSQIISWFLHWFCKLYVDFSSLDTFIKFGFSSLQLFMFRVHKGLFKNQLAWIGLGWINFVSFNLFYRHHAIWFMNILVRFWLCKGFIMKRSQIEIIMLWWIKFVRCHPQRYNYVVRFGYIKICPREMYRISWINEIPDFVCACYYVSATHTLVAF